MNKTLLKPTRSHLLNKEMMMMILWWTTYPKETFTVYFYSVYWCAVQLAVSGLVLQVSGGQTVLGEPLPTNWFT